jgi:phospholipid/cholesterol/gamma-HCH transport system ATP-binding protein
MSIEVQNLKKSFADKEVLKGISFSFEKGKVNMIIGASGSGKSVMLKCMVGLIQPNEGHVLYEGADFAMANHEVKRDIRNNIGMLFQGAALFDSMNVYENVAFPIRMFTKMKKEEIQARVAFCLDRVNLVNCEKLLPSELSGGMKKRVGIARAIALNPKYLFVDEPNSGLDPLTSSVIDKLIQEITQEYNMTTIVVSHDMNSVMNIGDKIMFLYKGKKEWEGTNRMILKPNNKFLEEFVFVSDLIRRD